MRNEEMLYGSINSLNFFLIKIINFETDKIMKKKYFAPNMEVVKIQTQQMLAASPIPMGDPLNDASGAEAPEYEWSNWEF